MVSLEQEVKMSSFWSEGGCVLFFMRRFGWMFCRVAAKELSALAPHLAKANVRLIGIGLEELGVEEFIEGKFFDGGKFCVHW